MISNRSSGDATDHAAEDVTAIASPAWVPVGEGGVDVEHNPLEGFSDSDGTFTSDDDDGDIKDDAAFAQAGLRQHLCDMLHDGEGCDCDKCCAKKPPRCFNVKGISAALANGVCRVVNSLVSFIREKLTRRQMFLLAGAAVAAVFKTRNVALDELTPAGIVDNDLVADSEKAGSSNISSDVIGSLVEAAVDSFSRDSPKD